LLTFFAGLSVKEIFIKPFPFLSIDYVDRDGWASASIIIEELNINIPMEFKKISLKLKIKARNMKKLNWQHK
jgi:hypothetical protein